jgi:hypothetical protein
LSGFPRRGKDFLFLSGGKRSEGKGEIGNKEISIFDSSVEQSSRLGETNNEKEEKTKNYQYQF